MKQIPRFDANVIDINGAVAVYHTTYKADDDRRRGKELLTFISTNYTWGFSHLIDMGWFGYTPIARYSFLSKAACIDRTHQILGVLRQWNMQPPKLDYAHFCEIVDSLKDNEWLVIDRSTKGIAYLTMPPAFDRECQRNLERRVFNELVSVPAGRFKGLLADGGVEYQRQVAQFGELANQLN